MPDGYRDYWHDLRKSPLLFSRRNFGGGSLMIWGAFQGNRKLELAFVNGRMGSNEYQDLLETKLIPFLENRRQENFIFQQDGAPPHRSKSTKNWLNDRNIPILDWPACSPDLNPIENVWGIMVRRIYGNNMRYENVGQLKEAILRAWDSITEDELQNLYLSMNNRIFQIINRSGAATDY